MYACESRVRQGIFRNPNEGGPALSEVEDGGRVEEDGGVRNYTTGINLFHTSLFLSQSSRHVSPSLSFIIHPSLA